MHPLNPEKKANCYVLTISDTRTLENDESGKVIINFLEKNNHILLGHSLVMDDPAKLRSALRELLHIPKIECLILTGGTGISPRDITCDTLIKFFKKPLEGFGEFFRWLSFKEIGPYAILSRAMAGITQNGVLVFALPGSKNAVQMAMDKIIIPILPHAVDQAKGPNNC